MGTLLSRRPSPALVISMVALGVAIGGGSVAAAPSDDEVDQGIAEQAVHHSELWGVVDEVGNLVQRRNAISSRLIPGTSTYEVQFDRDVSQCSYTATLRGISSGEISAKPSRYDQIVLVHTSNSTGGEDALPFQLQVEC